MGYFTWTDAAKKPRKNRYGFWSNTSKIANDGYYGYCKVVCPDNTVIEENRYQGYGMFGGHDVYDLVVDWNREDLREIFRNKSGVGGSELKEYAEMLADGIPDSEISEKVKEAVRNKKLPEYLEKDWKRSIGISISCYDEDMEKLRYPIKITSSKENLRYDELGMSLSTQ